MFVILTSPRIITFIWFHMVPLQDVQITLYETRTGPALLMASTIAKILSAV
jgi:hypothetical protein